MKTNFSLCRSPITFFNAEMNFKPVIIIIITLKMNMNNKKNRHGWSLVEVTKAL